jgi:hypothetical protein
MEVLWTPHDFDLAVLNGMSIRAHDSPVARIASDHLPLASAVTAISLVADRMPSLDVPPSIFKESAG